MTEQICVSGIWQMTPPEQIVDHGVQELMGNYIQRVKNANMLTDSENAYFGQMLGKLHNSRVSESQDKWVDVQPMDMALRPQKIEAKLLVSPMEYTKEVRDDLSDMIERNLLSYISTRRLKRVEEIPNKIKNLSKNGLIKLMDFIISPKRDKAIIKVIDDIKEGEKHIFISRENVPSKTDNVV